MSNPNDEAQSERDRAAVDVWERTISQIPTTFGKIAYLSSLRNGNSGRYQHYGLAQIYSEEEANRVLRACHQEVFARWLNYSLLQQRQDLEAYLNSIEDERKTVLATWLDLNPYRNLIPAERQRSRAAPLSVRPGTYFRVATERTFPFFLTRVSFWASCMATPITRPMTSAS